MTRPHQSADARSITRKLNGCVSCPTITHHPTQGLGQSPGPFSCLKSPRHAGFRPHVYVLAIRSTELLPRTYPGSDGQPVRGRDGRVVIFGDGERDMRADMGIANMGFALGQIDSVLKQLDAFAAEHPGAKFELVGSSLSGNIVYALSVLRPDLVKQDPGSHFIFNATGIGTTYGHVPSTAEMNDIMTRYRQAISDPAAVDLDWIANEGAKAQLIALRDAAAAENGLAGQLDSEGNLYKTNGFQFAEALIKFEYQTGYPAVGNAALGVTQTSPALNSVVSVGAHAPNGYEGPLDADGNRTTIADGRLVTFGGVQSENLLQIPIAGQAFYEGTNPYGTLFGSWPAFLSGSDMGNNHSTVGLYTSIQLQASIERLQGDFSFAELEGLFAAAGAQRALFNSPTTATVDLGGSPHPVQGAEGDTVPNLINALGAFVGLDLNAPYDSRNSASLKPALRQQWEDALASITARIAELPGAGHFRVLRIDSMSDAELRAAIEDPDVGPSYRFAIEQKLNFIVVGGDFVPPATATPADDAAAWASQVSAYEAQMQRNRDKTGDVPVTRGIPGVPGEPLPSTPTPPDPRTQPDYALQDSGVPLDGASVQTLPGGVLVARSEDGSATVVVRMVGAGTECQVLNADGSVRETVVRQGDDEGNLLVVRTDASGAGTATAIGPDNAVIRTAVVQMAEDGSSAVLTSQVGDTPVELDATYSNGVLTLVGYRSINGVQPQHADLLNAALADSNINARDLLLMRESNGLIAAGANAGNPAVEGGYRPVETAPGVPWYASGEAQELGGALTSVQSLLAALESGRPLPIASSIFSLAHHLSRHVVKGPDGRPTLDGGDATLAGIDDMFSGVSSLVGLFDALDQGDALGAVRSGLNVSVVLLKAYKTALDAQIVATYSSVASAKASEAGAQMVASSEAAGAAIEQWGVDDGIWLQRTVKTARSGTPRWSRWRRQAAPGHAPRRPERVQQVQPTGVVSLSRVRCHPHLAVARTAGVRSPASCGWIGRSIRMWRQFAAPGCRTNGSRRLPPNVGAKHASGTPVLELALYPSPLYDVTRGGDY